MDLKPNPNNGSKTVYILTNYNVLYYKKTEMCYARYEKPLKNHPLELAKKLVETYSSSNAAAHDPEERVQLDKPRHYTIYTDAKEKKKRARRTTD